MNCFMGLNSFAICQYGSRKNLYQARETAQEEMTWRSGTVSMARAMPEPRQVTDNA
jgi:hypothetical protein